MKSCEELVAHESEYFIYYPSKTAQKMFLYPLYAGYFIYKSGYSLRRISYDSFLIMYIQKGKLTLEYEGRTQDVTAGNFVFIDCYKPHAYYSDTGWESLWCHFDGVTARAHYESIVSRLGNSFFMPDPYPVLSKLSAIYNTFYSGDVIKEPLMSKYLNDILTAFHLYTPNSVLPRDYINVVEETISYINKNFARNINVEHLAERTGFSPYHFIRIFKKETGLTPYEYIVNVRINTAKYLLRNSRLSVKDICYSTGFSSESVFCSAFKRRLGVTPTEYRTMKGN
ncbi:AraC family transcriptional regulator [Thermoclostridium stercorarium]|uniref:helix-turn-helix domain-containing protein n=1 Tax=Thermoclostridium stercorarium TaxID=1510 RepID=UPI0022491FF4|nr:AraC family transcriptional regulator [Thermoclostridium stercorarium]UZQ85206.1 AraC family transcriptional regulator [Thermoclostridium stercorarium]